TRPKTHPTITGTKPQGRHQPNKQKIWYQQTNKTLLSSQTTGRQDVASGGHVWLCLQRLFSAATGKT
ncbi:hypothetical protein, partial [Kocuria soli]|uniref:hypothetical protein n=1 Tax=Kocuria soli TaxID=2485125 RepID=UPI001F210C6E